LPPVALGLDAPEVHIHADSPQGGRQAPERAYDPEFYQSFAKEVGWRLG